MPRTRADHRGGRDASGERPPADGTELAGLGHYTGGQGCRCGGVADREEDTVRTKHNRMLAPLR